MFSTITGFTSPKRSVRRIRNYYFLFAVFLTVLHPESVSGQDVFTISNSYQNLLSNREQTGILDRVFIEVFERLDMEIEIVFTSTNRSMVDVNAGIIDAEANRIAGMEESYPHLRRVPEPNMTMEFVAFARRDLQIDGWESIRNLDVGLVRGWKILEDHTTDFPFVVTVPTEVELFNMLRRDRIDVALYAKLTGYAVLQEMGLEGIQHLEPPLATRDMYLYVHERHADLTDDIAQALREIKQDGTYQSIVNQVRAEYGIDTD
jgi:polar amino acid transport system substrate-binding protein